MSVELDLDKLLGDSIAEQLATLDAWSMSAPVSEGDKTIYTLGAEGVGFNFYVSEGTSAVLEWETEIPEELQIGGDGKDLMRFLDLTTVKLPRYLYHPGTRDKNLRNSYGKHSVISFNYLNGTKTFYRLSDTNNIIKLTEDYLNPETNMQIGNVIINGNKDASGKDDAFVLGIELLDPLKSNVGRIRVAVPFGASGEAALNPRFLNWALSTQDGIKNPTGRIERVLSEPGGGYNLAKELSGKIRSVFPQPLSSE